MSSGRSELQCPTMSCSGLRASSMNDGVTHRSVFRESTNRFISPPCSHSGNATLDPHSGPGDRQVMRTSPHRLHMHRNRRRAKPTFSRFRPKDNNVETPDFMLSNELSRGEKVKFDPSDSDVSGNNSVGLMPAIRRAGVDGSRTRFREFFPGELRPEYAPPTRPIRMLPS